jgi:GNAT superfamily N-acetyltransferase
VSDLGLHTIQQNDKPKAIDVLFEAFRNDLFFNYMLGVRSKDARIAIPIHAFILNLGTKYGEVHAPSSRIEGVALWLPPDNARITAWKALRSGVLRLVKVLPRNYKGAISFSKRMLAYARYSDELHERYVPFPHWYLLAIGIGDDNRGKGYASKLIKPMLERCDRDKLPCYLETHNEKNIEVYRHFGFDVIDVGKLPGVEQRQWAMLRKPRV